jgi:hypothetical protein
LNNFKEKALKVSDVLCKLVTAYYQEKNVLSRLEVIKKKVYGELFNKYRFNFEYQLDSRIEVDVYINADDKYYDISLKHARQENIVKVIELHIKNVNLMSHGITNFTKMHMLENGL